MVNSDSLIFNLIEQNKNKNFEYETKIQKEHWEIVKTLKKIREEKGISQKQLSEKTGLKQQAISRLEHYSTPPNLITLVKYLDGLDISLLSLLQKKEEN